ncbi:MAG: PepSY domain-containing protein [Candidatus Electrothrix sp. AR3]|nr:PepSY domain-containing protein [Candidatus Electrothrix sp. AR3]
MKIRTMHRTAALVLAPFFLLAAGSGCLLLLRKTEVYSKEIKKLLVSLHTWEIIMPYIGAVLGVGLMAMTISGIILYFKRNA